MGNNGVLGTAMDFAFGKSPKINAPEKRNYLTEMQGALNAQGGIQDQLLGLEGQYTPRYQALQQAGISGGMQSLGNLYGQAGGISAGLQSDYLGMQAPIYGQVGQAAMGAYQQSLDPATRGLYSSMMSSAQDDLNAGRGMTPQMQQMAQQTARQASAARGLSGNQAVAQEIMNSYQMQNSREDRARQFAGTMLGQGVSQTNSAMNMYGQPLMSQMANFSPTALIAGGQSMYGGLGAKLFQPESQYNAGIQGFNISNDMQTQLANAQIKASHQAAQMKLVGDAISGAKSSFGTT
ncbi:hypothetical protein UFOVP1151_30 [uncultured Caudovirales phage]|uniref:Uncharacterized protein n=1 Tax=uncultured Caudovirales phage TaxID=2100421 RepID=A0A6J5QPM2_9CAUD|nr:hypothetical protein UFOVP1151_30 [uncultured Caudovirales phage]